MYLLIDKHIPENHWKQANVDGYLFGSKGTPDIHMKKHRELLGAALREIEDGFYKKKIVQTALERHADKQKGTFANLDGEVPFRVQAANFCGYFTSLRSTKRNSTSGIRLDDTVKFLLGLLKYTGSF